MNPKLHRILVQVFLVLNSLFWLPWGMVNLIWPKSWSGEIIPGLDVYNLSSAVARTEVRAMYGGLQIAIGVFALIGAFWPKYRESVLLFFVLALTGLATCRFAGMVAEHDSSYLSFSTKIAPGKYNQVGLAMYELPNMIIAWVLFLIAPRTADEISELDALRAENELLRSRLSVEVTGPQAEAGVAIPVTTIDPDGVA